MGVPWGRQFLAPPSKVLSTGASRARVSTPVEGERGKPTLVEARHHQGGRILTGRRGFSCQQAKVAPATPMEGEGGKLLARMSLAQGSSVDSLEGNNTVEAAATAVSPSATTTMGSTATSRTRPSTTRTRTTGGASATTA